MLACARALLAGTAEGRTAYVDTSFLGPEAVLESAELSGTLDLTRPVALSVVALLHFRPLQSPTNLSRDVSSPDCSPPCCYLNLSNGTADLADEEFVRAGRVYERLGIATQSRSLEAVSRFVDGLALANLGVMLVHRRRPDPTVDGSGDYTDGQLAIYGGVARCPEHEP